MAIAASPTVSLPATPQLISTLEQAVKAVNDLISVLQAQGGTGAAAGAGALGGGGSGHACCGARGAVAGAQQVGQAPPKGGANGAPAPKGASGAPDAKAAGGGSGLGQRMVDEVRTHLGKAYQWGAEGPDTFDCSGLMQYVAKQMGIDIPRVAKDQANAGTAVEKDQLQPGDLVYFQGPGKSEVSHIGMYIGNGEFIHAPKTGDVVKVSRLDESYYQQAYRGARRLG